MATAPAITVVRITAVTKTATTTAKLAARAAAAATATGAAVTRKKYFGEMPTSRQQQTKFLRQHGHSSSDLEIPR